MLRLNARACVRIFRRLDSSKSTILARYLNDKSKKGVSKIQKLRVEENLLFGKLIETKRKKLKRLKLECKGEIPKAVASNVDSEFAWALASASKSNTKIIKAFTDSKASRTDDVDSRAYHDESVIAKKESLVGVAPVDEPKEVIQDPSVIQKEAIKRKKKLLLSDDFVQRLLEFPIIESQKSSEIKEVEADKILSISATEDRSLIKYPSVTKILTATMSEKAKDLLEQWKARLIEKLGIRGFEVYQAELLGEGRMLHSTIMSKLTQKPFEVPERVRGSFASLNEVLADVNKVQAIESHVFHSTLLYRGVVDCVAIYRDELCLIDWKKSDRTKDNINSTYDAPLQLASYIGALNSDKNYPFQIKKGLIIVAYTSGEPAKVHEINEKSLESYWKLWLKRLQEYHISLKPS